MKEKEFTEVMATELGVPTSELVMAYAVFIDDLNF